MSIYLQDIVLEFENNRVIDKITMDISEHRVGIIGVNGSGKSTLARLITGLIAPTSGKIRVNDIDVFKDRKGALKTIGIIFQNPDHQIIFPTCAEEISFGLAQQGMKRAEADKKARVILSNFNRLDWSDRLAHNLSQGQRHYLCLISVLAMEPEIIILDEPYAGLDLPTSLQLHEILNDLKQQLIMITHDPNILADFDRIIWMDNGEVIGDGPANKILSKFTVEMKRRAHAGN